MEDYYWHGMTTVVYLVTCFCFAAIRAFHTCQATKDELTFFWPDRRMQIVIFMSAIILLPYMMNPRSTTAWILYKSYFPCTYYFYCAALLLCFFGSVKQRNPWRIPSWIAAIVTILAIGPLAVNAWLPEPFLTHEGLEAWSYVIVSVSVLMFGFSVTAMWQVWRWMKESSDENYSNEEDFPINYAQRVWLAPIFFSPLIWPAYVLDSRSVMDIINIILAVSNIMLLINVMPTWRRKAIMPDIDEHDANFELSEEKINSIISEINTYVKGKELFLNTHLKLNNVVDNCTYSRSYVSKALQERYGGFYMYINSLRLSYFDLFIKEHPNYTKEAAAIASGFSSYLAYYRFRERARQDGSKD